MPRRSGGEKQDDNNDPNKDGSQKPKKSQDDEPFPKPKTNSGQDGTTPKQRKSGGQDDSNSQPNSSSDPTKSNRKSGGSDDTNQSKAGSSGSDPSKPRTKKRSKETSNPGRTEGGPQRSTDQPQPEFVPGPKMLVPKQSRVIETIILDHTPSLDLELEVDRLVSIATTQCDREKNDIKRRYEDELRTLRNKLEDENNKIKANCDESFKVMKTQVAEESRKIVEKEVVEPLKANISRLEKDLQSLKAALEAAESAKNESKRIIEDLQNKNKDLKDDLKRADEAGRQNEKFKEEIARLTLIEQESQHLKQRYSEIKTETDELKKKLESLRDVEKNNIDLKQSLEAMKALKEENLHLKDNLNRGSEEIKKLQEQLGFGEETNSSLKKEAKTAAGNCAEENRKLKEQSAKLSACEAKNAQLQEELDKLRSGNGPPSAVAQAVAPLSSSLPPPPPLPVERVCSKCSKNNSCDSDERQALQAKVRSLERRVEELVQYVDSVQQGRSGGMSLQRTAVSDPVRPSPSPGPQRSSNMNAVLDRLGSLERTLGMFNQRYDSQMSQLQSNMREQDSQYRSVLGEFSNEISAIKNLVRNQDSSGSSAASAPYNNEEGCCD